MEAATPEHEPAAINGGNETPPFSLELSQDQKDIRDWVLGFPSRRSGRRLPHATNARRRPGVIARALAGMQIR